MLDRERWLKIVDYKEDILMKKKMKKIAFLVFALLLAMTVLGCGNDSSSPTQSNTGQIPEDGIIEQVVFEQIYANNDIGVFNGSNNQINFQWLFMGSQITQPADANLMLNFSNARTSEVRAELGTDYVQEFSFATPTDIDGRPSLTIYLPTAWDVEEVVVYDFDTQKVISSASIEHGPNGIVTFTPTDFRGLFYLVGIENVENLENLSASMVNVADFLGLEESTSGNGDSLSASNENGANGSSSDDANAGNQGGGGSNGQSGNNSNQGGNGSSNQGSGNQGGGGQNPAPRPPQDQSVDSSVQKTATLTISVATLLNNMDMLDARLHSLVPSSGLLMPTRTVTFSAGENVFDVLQRETRAAGIHMVHRSVPAFNSVYIESIGNLGEFDAGSLSGWVYKVNGWGPNFGASQYVLEQGDVIEWHFTVDLGNDVGVTVGN